MEPSSLRFKGKSELGTSSPSEQSEHTEVSSSGKRRKATVPLRPFRLTEEEMVALGMCKSTATTKSPKLNSKKLELKPFRISEYLPESTTKSTTKSVVMPSGTIMATSRKETGAKRRLMLPSTSETKNPCNVLPIKTLFRSPKKSVSVKVSQLRRESAGRHLRIPKISKIPAVQKAAETSCSTPLLNTSELENVLVKKGSLSDYEFKSPQIVITRSTPSNSPNNFRDSTDDPEDPIGLINGMITAEIQTFREDQRSHEEKIRKCSEIIAAEEQSFKRRQETHEEYIQTLKRLSLSIQNNDKENNSKSLNTVEVQSPRTEAALKMFKSLRFDHPMRTPKIENAQNTPRRDLSMVRLGVMKECWLLQDTPVHK